MRLSNKKKIPRYTLIHSLLATWCLLGVLIYFVEKYKMDFLGQEANLLIAIPVVVLMLFWLRGKQIFEYDSDGETLTFNNYFMLPFFKKTKKDEFPKYKMIGYEVKSGWVNRKLIIKIHSKKNICITLRYDISYLRRKEVQDLKRSLARVITTNNEKNQSTHTH